jgi:pantoate--beta-alanine ligase
MKIIKTVRHMQRVALGLKRRGVSIGLVPTMGALHEGHLSLIRGARAQNGCVVVSIFVNPAQFGPGEDYLRYPRPFAGDRRMCAKAGAYIVFAPSVKEMYPGRQLAYVEVTELSDILCGKCRPGHFRGVATVVTKLFNIVMPDSAYFGEKDYQQLQVIRKMAKDLNFPVKIRPCPVIREKDGLAMSSRNVYLKGKERPDASRIYETLKTLRELILKRKIGSVSEALRYARKNISAIPSSRIDYISFCDSETLEEIKEGKLRPPLRLLVAVKLGKTRLIDNIELR